MSINTNASTGTSHIQRILIADTQSIYRQGLKHWLHRHYPDARIVATNQLERALRISRRWPAEWLFIDVQLVAQNPDHYLGQLSSLCPDGKLFTLGMTPSRISHKEIDRHLSVEKLAEQLTQPATSSVNLTPAQRRVLQGLLSGQINKQIASQLNISEATIKAHLTEIYRKLGVANRTQALAKLHTGTLQ